ncbi:cell division protein FtsW [candidate division WOR-1 bacterium RIFOXYA12_FULL_43_27]|uniref:Probable peptidoglycan glycosyltransferase FtsW n=1 Tax=candidate division WOR-1 bacterium RIFOXYC2_FULL_46_14 TaxID=1802587 RepID=A0A1F4U3P5_UNCSA|nr:MAG: cell division protein FtsW [candidate division WOR-1 bacterium RIFOXYA12_FULL_43_27]OGC20066.1 MAG: cell division protein FtsW [candidate division WOR-1 bacterium RIFOXYB2_FULL_46_45]OGC32198.1 MAG: cell division protein FtsW [candidate division WOR-1 bacterium RIFOXYA2_FULL_46_56]OGC39598.1 MAG: cell division protein FtsW [candidate division WOR-1 bacterium RIFOXYC2_FULL_46_14]
MKKKHPDYLFISLLAVMVIIGIIMILSAGSAMALKNTGDSFYYFKRHLFYLFLGLAFFYFGMNLDLATLRKRSFLFLTVAFLFSFMVFIPGFGKTMGGASRWIDFFGISFQPSELLKVALVIFLPHLLVLWEGKKIVPILGIVVIAVFPILLQPDLGTTLAIVGSSFLLLFIAGIKLYYMGIILFLGAAAVTALSIASPYRMRRLTSFLDPFKDPLGSGYQIIQSLIAVSSGGIFGVGLGNSRQKFLYLPQQYADFIFAIMCEEFGLIGASVFIVFLIVFLTRGFWVSSRASDPYSSLLGASIMSMFAVQAFMNIAVVIDLIPTTGLPLPFISYGGTSIVINLFAAGIVANISRAKR